MNEIVCNMHTIFICLRKVDRKMKRIIVLLLSAMMLLTLAACSGDKETTVEKNIAEVTAISELGGYKIAAQTGTFHAEALNQIDGVKSSTLPSFTDLLIALQAGTIDGYVAEEPTAISACQKDPSLSYLKLINNNTGFTASEEDTGIAIGLVKGSELTAKMNEILVDVNVDVQRELMSQMISLYNGGSVDTLALQSEAPVTTTGTLKVAMECAYDPYNWTELSNPTLGAVSIYDANGAKTNMYANGYDVQVAQYVANKLGLELQVYAIEWDSLIPAVQSKNVDAIIAGMSPTATRAQEIDFTDCYYNSNLVIIYKAQ